MELDDNATDLSVDDRLSGLISERTYNAMSPFIFVLRIACDPAKDHRGATIEAARHCHSEICRPKNTQSAFGSFTKTMTDMSVRMELLYRVREGAMVCDVLELLRAPSWVRSVMRLTVSRLKDASPADSSVLAKLENEWRILPGSSADHDVKSFTSCVICMDDSTRMEAEQDDSTCAVRLLCGHEYHFQCVRSWLQQRSSCPMCRHQFPKALSGKFVLQRVQSTLVLEDAHVLQLPRAEIASTAIASVRVRVIVTVRLQQVTAINQDKSSVPCEIRACVVGPNGELLPDNDRPASPAAFRVPEQGLTPELPQASECQCVETDETRKRS